MSEQLRAQPEKGQEVKSLGEILDFTYPLDESGEQYFKDAGVSFNPELQLQLIQIAEFEKGGRKLKERDLEDLWPRIEEILAQDAEAQKQFAALEEKIFGEGGPHAKRTFEAAITSVEVVHFPHRTAWVNTKYGRKPKSAANAYFRIRGKTAEGYVINVTKRDTPSSVNIGRKREDMGKAFHDLVGQRIFALLHKSANGRYFANAIASKLPEQFKK